MNTSTTMNNDIIIRGLLFGQTVNIIAISGTALVERARQLHSLSRVSTAALGRTLLAVSMMSARLKSDTDSITAVISGGGPIGNITVVGRTGGIVKGCVTNPEVELPLNEKNKLDVGGAVGHAGEMRIVRDFSLREPYVGRCPLVNGEIAEDFANYFLKSEQQPSLVYLGVRVEPHEGSVCSAAGVIIEPLPNCPDEDITRLEELAPRIGELSRLIDEGDTLETALSSIFDGMSFEITERLTPEFECDCSRERLAGVLVSLGEAELEDMIENDGQAEIVCRFCNEKYLFDRYELKALLDQARSDGQCEYGGKEMQDL